VITGFALKDSWARACFERIEGWARVEGSFGRGWDQSSLHRVLLTRLNLRVKLPSFPSLSRSLRSAKVEVLRGGRGWDSFALPPWQTSRSLPYVPLLDLGGLASIAVNQVEDRPTPSSRGRSLLAQSNGCLLNHPVALQPLRRPWANELWPLRVLFVSIPALEASFETKNQRWRGLPVASNASRELRAFRLFHLIHLGFDTLSQTFRSLAHALPNAPIVQSAAWATQTERRRLPDGLGTRGGLNAGPEPAVTPLHHAGNRRPRLGGFPSDNEAFPPKVEGLPAGLARVAP